MKVSIYLHSYVVETLRQFGTLTDVTNKILQHGDDGDIDIFDKPKTLPRVGAGRYEIDITTDSYLELLKFTAPNSPRISLRRLLYWFVDNEIYDELNWTPVTEYYSKTKEKCIKEFNLIKQHLEKLSLLNTHFLEITNTFKAMEEYL